MINMVITQNSCHESENLSQTTETEETEDEGTGNTGKHKPRCCWHPETKPSKSDEFSLLIDAARQMETLFEATLLTTDAQKGRGGCDGFRFKCSNGHEFTTSFDKILKFMTLGNSPTKTEAKDLWCIKCHNFYHRCVEKAT